MILIIIFNSKFLIFYFYLKKMQKYLKANKNCKFLLILTILISFTLNYEIIEYTYTDFIQEDTISEENVNGGKTYKISYEKGQISQNYIRIIAIPGIEEYLYIYYSPISENRKDAYLLNYGKTEISLYINKAFTKSEADGYIYLTIACFSKKCSYEFSILELDIIDLSRNGQYTFFTTDKKNIQNIFKIFRADSENEEGFLTFWATGSKDIQMNAKYIDESNKKETQINISHLENGKYAFIDEKDYPANYEGNSSLNYFIIEVISPVNSLVTVGSNLNFYMNTNKPTIYSPNSKEIYGILNNNSPRQCFDFDIKSSQTFNYYLNILDFQRNINVKIINEKGDEIKTYEICDGKTLIIITNENAGNYYCLDKKMNDNKDTSFALQVTYNIEKNYYKNIYSPQINGYFYERFLEAGEFAFFIGLSSIKYKTELRYYLKKITGYPEMYFVKCNSFPYCEFDLDNLPNGSIKISNINDIFSYSLYKTEINNAISPEQFVLLVFCNIDQSCSFETNFYCELDKIVLPKEKKIYQTIMKEGQNNFIIKLDGENSNYKQIFVDFLIYSGDISIKYEIKGFEVREYISANKKYFVLDKISENIESNDNNEINFYVIGELPSYYSIDYKLIFNDTDKIVMTEESGINYLEILEPKFGHKTISLVNSRIKEKRNFLVNFFSLNCEISITRNLNGIDKKLEKIDYLAQDIILNNEEIYNSEKYDYYMEIVRMDNVTKFDTNWCLVYVSSTENNLAQEKNYKKRQLLAAEGIINRVILNKSFPKIEYIYPHINPSGYIIIFFNIGTNSKINIKINIDDKQYKEITTGKSQYFIIEESILRSNEYCPLVNTRPNQICTIKIEIELDSQFYSEEPLIQLNIKSKEEIPSIISKTILRRDIIIGNYYQYYFAEIGKNEEGYVNINYDYGGGNVYGRIVKKNSDEGEGWMKKFILPNEKNNQLKYDYYNKKIYYNLEHTQNCDYGCFLFLKIEPNFSDEYFRNENIGYPISLYINSFDASTSALTQDLINSIDIQINEYIIGDTKPISGRFNDFYNFFIPYDCEEINFEFIGDSTFIFINLGNTKPNIDLSDFSLNEIGKNNILKITKNEILNKIGTTETSIKNVQLTIAVGANYFDNGNTSLYSFRIRALRKDEIEIIPLTNEQQTICDIQGKTGNCFFFIPHHLKIDEQNNFFFHALEIPNVEFNYYAYEVDKNIITNRDYEKIKNIISNKENAKWSNKDSIGNYIYIDNSEITDKENGVYILLNLEVKAPSKIDDEKTIITLLHTSYSYKAFILPNPSTPQLFLLNNHNSNEIYLNFEPYKENLIIHIKSITGRGKVFWDLSDEIQINYKENNSENENFYLNYPDESISLTIGNSEIFPLHFINTNKIIKNTNNQPGFGFYIYYERESKIQNYHNLLYGQSSLISFKDTDFPFIFYTKLLDKSHEVNINIKFNSLKSKPSSNYLKIEETENEIPLYDEFIINGLVLNEEFIYKKKSSSDLIPDFSKAINGLYDPTEKIIRIQFTPDLINNYKVDGNNYLYINITKGNNNNKIYTETKIECNVFPSNNEGYFSTMNAYINGKIPYEQKGYIRYELKRINSMYKYMRIEFAANSEKIDFSLNNFKSLEDINKINFYKNNTDFVSNEFYNGKAVIIIKLNEDDIKGVYLSVFNVQNSHINNEKKLSNFIFKYQINENNDFIKIKPQDNAVHFNYTRGAVNLILPDIDGISSLDEINYKVKLIPSKDMVKNENVFSISLIESKPIRIYTKKLNVLNKDQVLELIDIHNDQIYYVVINCDVIENNNEEKFSFQYIYNPTNYEEEENDKISLAIVIVIILIITIIAIIFFIVFISLKRTNLRKSIQLQELNQKLNESNVLG